MSGTIIKIIFIAAASIGLTSADPSLAQVAGQEGCVSKLQGQQRSLKEAERKFDEEFRQRMTQIAAQRSLTDRAIKEDKYQFSERRELSRVTIGKYDLSDGFSIACSIRAGRPICVPTSP